MVKYYVEVFKNKKNSKPIFQSKLFDNKWEAMNWMCAFCFIEDGYYIAVKEKDVTE